MGLETARDILIIIGAILAAGWMRIKFGHRRSDTSIDVTMETSDGRYQEVHNIPSRNNGHGS